MEKYCRNCKHLMCVGREPCISCISAEETKTKFESRYGSNFEMLKGLSSVEFATELFNCGFCPRYNAEFKVCFKRYTEVSLYSCVPCILEWLEGK